MIRPLEADDAERLRALFFRLSPSTVYLRFFQPVRPPTDAALQHLADVDHHQREAIAAVVDEDIIGVARYDRSVEHPERAEIAVVVEDAWQGRGVGTQLLAELTSRARDEGVDAVTASVLGENTRMLTMMRHWGPRRRMSIDHGVYDVEFPITALAS